MADCISEVWTVCGRLATVPKMWHEVLLYPIFKTVERDDPGNYHRIALLSHVRKVVEGAVDSAAKELVRLNAMKCEFREGRGVGHPLLRLIEARRTGHRVMSVLDLRGAYRSVPRSKLVEVLPPHPQLHTNRRRQKEGEACASQRVPEGSPLSPLLFNLLLVRLPDVLELCRSLPSKRVCR